MWSIFDLQEPGDGREFQKMLLREYIYALPGADLSSRSSSRVGGGGQET